MEAPAAEAQGGRVVASTLVAPVAPTLVAPLAPNPAQVDTISEHDSPGHRGPPSLAKVSTSWRLDQAPASAGEPRYDASAELGRGGMGRVLEAFDRRLGRVVAVKESFATDDDGRQRFEREVAITARLEHPSIVPLYDAGVTADGRAFYVMRKVSGRGLDRVMADLPTLDERLGLLPALLAACDAVAHAHARQVVHRDLKPANILIGDYGETMVIDWGLAKAIGESEPPGVRVVAVAPPPSVGESSAGRTKASQPPTAPPLLPDDLHTVVGAVFGTPGFMSPEQARGETLDTRGDVYALGATLYHLLAGRPPHVGKSATEVIDRVRLEPAQPLAEVCPGAPAELVAIVDKAMAFAIEQRYPDASALAGDLRRFLAGQLVAAHRYTFWQRARRLARTYRAAFLVAGASLLVLTALATLSVVRIVGERDEARRARRQAVREAAVAARARDQASARADELIVAQAQAQVVDNPTAAVSLLKRLPVDSPAWPRARMVAMGALAEGVARALPGTGNRPPAIFAMSPKGESLLIGEDHGRVWVVDLERMRARTLVELGHRPAGCWVQDGAAVLLAGPSGPVMLRDLQSGAVRVVPFGGAVAALACPRRGPVAVLDTDGELWSLDPALAQARKVASGLRSRDLEISGDGALLAASNDREVVLLDRDGATRARVAGEVLRVMFSPEGKLGVMLRDRVVELSSTGETLESQPVPKLAVAIYYLGERLRVLLAGNRFVLPDGTVHTDLSATPAGSAAIGERTTAVGLSDGSVFLSGWWGSRLMRTPATGPLIRMAGQPGSAHLAGWSRGTVLVWDLGGAIPRRIELGGGIGRPIFVAEHQLAISSQQAWHWIDLSTGKTREADHHELPMYNDYVIDPESGDTMLIDRMLGRAMLVRWARSDMVATWRDRATCAALLGGGAVVVGTSDGRVAVGKLEPGLEILKLEAAVVGVVKLGAGRVLAVDADGNTLAYDVAAAAQTRGSLGDAPSGPMTSDGKGGAVLSVGNRLLHWRGGVVRELAQLGEPVFRLTRYQHTLAIQTATELLALDLAALDAADPDAPPPTPRRLSAAAREQQLRDDSRWAVGVGQRGMIELVDVVTGVRWSKSALGGLAMFAVAPNGSRIAQVLNGAIALWTYEVPEEPAALRAWLDHLTNATVDDNLGVSWTSPERLER